MILLMMIAISGDRHEKEIVWARGAERRVVSSKGGAGGVMRRLVYISSVVYTLDVLLCP